MTAPVPSAIASVNFGFLAVHDPLLVRLAAQAEGYVFTDPEAALFKLRQSRPPGSKNITVITTDIADQPRRRGRPPGSKNNTHQGDAFATLLAALRAKGSLASSDAQAATGLDAADVHPLLQRLVAEGAAKVEGQKRGTRYVLTKRASP